jgi:recombination protein RecA
MFIFINQIRMKIGVMFGSPETTTGGNALKFYASVRLDVRRIGAIKEAAAGRQDMQVVGNRTRVKVVKNKLAAPFREVRVRHPVRPGHQSRSGDVLDLAAEASIVREERRVVLSRQGERIGQGRDAPGRTWSSTPAGGRRQGRAGPSQRGRQGRAGGRQAPGRPAPQLRPLHPQPVDNRLRRSGRPGDGSV